MLEKKLYDNYVQILKNELVPALGCTEPIAIAYAAAKAREVLGCFPDHVDMRCSGNIIKNVKGVTVPNSDGMKGIDVAAILGIVAVMHPVNWKFWKALHRSILQRPVNWWNPAIVPVLFRRMLPICILWQLLRRMSIMRK